MLVVGLVYLEAPPTPALWSVSKLRAQTTSWCSTSHMVEEGVWFQPGIPKISNTDSAPASRRAGGGGGGRAFNEHRRRRSWKRSVFGVFGATSPLLCHRPPSRRSSVFLSSSFSPSYLRPFRPTRGYRRPSSGQSPASPTCWCCPRDLYGEGRTQTERSVHTIIDSAVCRSGDTFNLDSYHLSPFYCKPKKPKKTFHPNKKLNEISITCVPLWATETHSKHCFPQVLVSEVSVQVIFCSGLLETTRFPSAIMVPRWLKTKRWLDHRQFHCGPSAAD